MRRVDEATPRRRRHVGGASRYVVAVPKILALNPDQNTSVWTHHTIRHHPFIIPPPTVVAGGIIIPPPTVVAGGIIFYP